MHISVETIRKLIDYQSAKDRQAEQVMRARNAGDEETVHFLELPAQVQQTMLAQQDIADAVDAANAGDRDGLRQGITRAVNRAVFGGAQLVKPPHREAPRPRRRVR